MKNINLLCSVESFFMMGAKETTPDIFEIRAKWPRVWLFVVFLAFALALYGCFLLGWNFFRTPNLLPGLILTGSFAVPLATAVLFLEFNIRRNVSLCLILEQILFGGVLSLLFALIFLFYDEVFFNWFGVAATWKDVFRAPIEEFAKIVVVFPCALCGRFRYVLNGLVLGAAVGVGFAAFESAGYALSDLLNVIFNSDIMIALARHDVSDLDVLTASAEIAKDTVLQRGVLAPFSHVAWTAIASFGLWWARGFGAVRVGMFFNWRFLLMFFIACVLHAIWNAPWELPYLGVNLICGCVAWVVIIFCIRFGIKQISLQQSAILNKLGCQIHMPGHSN